MEGNWCYRLSSLKIGYKDNTVAEEINATLQAGELVCLVGRNGSGKSTLLRTMAGLQRPLSGSVMLSGGMTSPDCDLYALSANERARTVSVVLTDAVQADGLTVANVVAAGRSPSTGFFGVLSDADHSIVSQSLERVGMCGFARRPMVTLSDGERQKVMIAKALAQQTPVILLDEPTAFLDYPSKMETLQLLSQLCHEERKAIIVSTHDLDAATGKADRLWVMDEKKDAAYLSSFITPTLQVCFLK